MPPMLSPQKKVQQTNWDRRWPRAYRLTRQGLALLRQAAQEHQPWRRSTGPQTMAGKARASRNALKHGERSAGQIAAWREVAATLRMLREATAGS